MKKFAFVNIPSQELERPPAAAAAISACVKKVGWDCRVFDFNLYLNTHTTNHEWSELETYWRCKVLTLSPEVKHKLHTIIDRFISEIKEYQPDVIGISVFTRFSVVPAWILLQEFRKSLRCKLIIGGAGAFAWPGSLPALSDGRNQDAMTLAEYAKQQGLIDHYILGDGEIAIMQFLSGSEDTIAGLDGADRQQILDLESLPYPDYDGIEPSNYYYTHQPGIYITGSRGCVRKCTFCNVPDIWPKFTSRSANDVVSEIINGKKKYGVNLFHFTDSLLNGNMKNWREINQLLIDAKKHDPDLDGIIYMGQFICRTRMDQTDRDWNLMAQAGANLLVTGFESFSPAVRRHMGKNYSNEDIAFHFQQSAWHGIRNVALMFVGYPTETLEDHEYNIEFLHRFQKYAKSGTIHMVRWGYTGMFRDSDKLEARGGVKMTVDPEFSKKFQDLPQGIRDIALGFGWINEVNPSLDLRERIRRRLELHEISAQLGWPQTRNREELQILYNILDNLNRNRVRSDDFEALENLLDFH